VSILNAFYNFFFKMTCTIGYIDGNVVVMGSDSAATTEDNSLKLRKGSTKVWIQNDYLIGFCGHFSVLMFLKHVFKWPTKKDHYSIEYWLLKKVFPKIRDYFKERPDVTWTLMFGFPKPGRLIILDQFGDIEETHDNFAVIGSSENLALGCLKGMENLDIPSWEKIDKALSVAEKYNNSVKGPMYIEYIMKM